MKENNHELMDEAEAELLVQNLFIPEEVHRKILGLNGLGVLSCSQIMTLIEKEHPDIKKTWSTRESSESFSIQY